MRQILRITTNPLQKQILVLDDGSSFSITMYFRPMQQGWFITELVYGDFTLTELRICNSPNMLYQFQNQLPFGIGCFSTNNREPSLQEDFSSGASKLYILDEADVAAYSEFIRLG